MFYERYVHSPIGELRLVSSIDALVGLYLHGHKGAPPIDAHEGQGHPVLAEAARQLDEYFAGQRQGFQIPFDLRGTAFQEAVWRALSAIPFGATRSYAELARALGRPGASRAVGAANARNPISILVPCHRVVGGDGGLTGYAGGLEAKRWLLAHERIRGPARSTQVSREMLADSLG
jgi:methylated-DNA-[protein]-cysteine S-methyltransferase